MVPWANIPRSRAAAASVSCSTEAARVIATVARMPVTRLPRRERGQLSGHGRDVLVHPRAAEHEVGVAVHEPGRDHTAGRVDHRCTADVDPVGDLLGGADVDDPLAGDGDDPVGDHAQRVIRHLRRR